MTFPSLLALAVGLSMDAMAVAAGRGVSARSVSLANVVAVAAFFGGFQALMPMLGYFLGAQFGAAVAAFGDWIAFFIFSALGAKMIYESLAQPDASEQHARTSDPFAWPVLALLAVATSIDAFAAGITLFLLRTSLAVAVVTIGSTTFALSFAGVYVGRRFGDALGTRLGGFGGFVLVALAAKLLWEHFAG